MFHIDLDAKIFVPRNGALVRLISSSALRPGEVFMCNENLFSHRGHGLCEVVAIGREWSMEWIKEKKL